MDKSKDSGMTSSMLALTPGTMELSSNGNVETLGEADLAEKMKSYI